MVLKAIVVSVEDERSWFCLRRYHDRTCEVGIPGIAILLAIIQFSVLSTVVLSRCGEHGPSRF